MELPYREAKQRLLERFHLAYLQHVMRSAQGNVSEAARRAGVERKYFYRLLAKYGMGPTR